VCAFVPSCSPPFPFCLPSPWVDTILIAAAIHTRVATKPLNTDIYISFIRLRVGTRRFGNWRWKRQSFQGEPRRCSLAHGLCRLSMSRVLEGHMCMFHVNTPHNCNCLSIPSTQLFIVDPNSKISTNILRINVMLLGKMGHQNRVIVCPSHQLHRT